MRAPVAKMAAVLRWPPPVSAVTANSSRQLAVGLLSADLQRPPWSGGAPAAELRPARRCWTEGW